MEDCEVWDGCADVEVAASDRSYTNCVLYIHFLLAVQYNYNIQKKIISLLNESIH